MRRLGWPRDEPITSVGKKAQITEKSLWSIILKDLSMKKTSRSSTRMDTILGPVNLREFPPDGNDGGDHPFKCLKSSVRASAVDAQSLIMNCIVLVLAVTPFGQISAQSTFSLGSAQYNCSSNIICLGTAHKYTGRAVSNGIQLYGRLSLIEEAAYYTQGIAYYREPVRLQDLPTQQAYNFNTSFVITTVKGVDNGTSTVGDGMAFVISADNSTIGSSGKHFGIFNDRGITTFKSVVVEFDTWENPDVFDISNNHVSFDFSNVVYADAANASDVNVTLGNEGTMYAWVEYRHKIQQLDVRVSNSNTRPVRPLLKYTINLYNFIQEFMWVGFSSGSGDVYSNCYIGDWTFQSYLTLDSSPAAPASSPDPASSPAPGNSVAAGEPIEHKASENKSGMKLGIIVGISVGVPAILLAFIAIALFVWRCGRRGQVGWAATEKDRSMQLEGMPERFSYKQLRVATRAFSQEAKLGSGGFGSVYRGMLSSGIPVAVKKINSDSSQGEREFMAEVSIISRLRHRNLIQLLGWCKDASKGNYLLVYELMPNGSLDKVLFQGPSTQKQTASLSWLQRFNIVTGTAAAVDYLHQGWTQQVIHRDIKASNIILDKEWNAKLGDFGLARLVDHQNEAPTTLVAGTYGYIAPEVPSTGRFTDKSDVYAFGAVVLEVACGRKALSTLLPIHEMILVDWVWRSLSEGDLMKTVDKRLEDYDANWMEVLLRVGLLCSHPDPFARPSMKHVVQILAGDLPVPPIPTSKPALVFSSRSETASIHAPKGSNSTSWTSSKSSSCISPLSSS